MTSPLNFGSHLDSEPDSVPDLLWWRYALTRCSCLCKLLSTIFLIKTE